jgi:hypothetical protein
MHDILIDRDYVALSSNVRRRGGLEQLLTALGQLYAAGRGPKLERLFAGRRVAEIDLAGTTPVRLLPLLDNTMPMLRLALRGCSSISNPHMFAVPAVLLTSPAKILIIVDLPAPLGPSSPNMLPRGISRSMPFSACLPPA